MPVVLSYDDPALVATLASQAGQYARSQDQLDQANRAAQLSSALTADANQQVLSFNQQFYNQRNTEQELAIKAMEAAGGGGVRQQGQGGYLHPQQQNLMGYVDQLEQGRHIGADEAIRYRAMVAAGENPFGQPTLNEEVRKALQ